MYTYCFKKTLCTPANALHVNRPRTKTDSEVSKLLRAKHSRVPKPHRKLCVRRVQVSSTLSTQASAALTISVFPDSVAISTSNVAKAFFDDDDWDLLLGALAAKRSLSLDEDGYLKLCEASASSLSFPIGESFSNSSKGAVEPQDSR